MAAAVIGIDTLNVFEIATVAFGNLAIILRMLVHSVNGNAIWSRRGFLMFVVDTRYLAHG